MAMGAAFRAANLSTAFRVRKVCVVLCMLQSGDVIWRYPLDTNNETNDCNYNYLDD